MTDRPSDRAYAQAFREHCDPDGSVTADFLQDGPGLARAIERRAREIDAAAPEGAQAVACNSCGGRGKECCCDSADAARAAEGGGNG